ncbi:MAG: Crp/Fnr family transcriptional regulator [Peptococcaceae bacterium]|nr:Crp/Fnr family transcriptional regulator [Peptococcaceae bacterium]
MIKKELSIDQGTWENLLKLGTARKFDPNEIIFFQDQPSSGLVCIKKGKIKTCMFFPNGKEKIFTFLDAPCFLGETPVIDGGMNTCSAIAIDPTEIVFISREDALKFLSENQGLYMIILRIMATKMRWMHMQVNDMLFPMKQRLAYFLFNYNDYGVFPNKEMSQKLVIKHDDLANLLGTTRPLITKYLNEFCKSGLIEKSKGFILIKDYEGLKKLSNADTSR